MKTSELRQIIREEIKSVLKDGRKPMTKVYVQSTGQIPKGKKIHKGPQGGIYYLASPGELQTSQPSSKKSIKNKNIEKPIPDKIKPTPVKSINVDHKKLSDNENEFLLNLIHQKEHVMDNNQRIRELDKIFSMTKNNINNEPLYRGLYVENVDDFKVGKEYKFNRYQSFSEDLDMAKQFSQNNIILQLDRSKGGFNYAEYLKKYFSDLQQEDPEEFDMIDGEFMIDSADEEKEWLFNINSKVKIKNIEERDGFTFITGEI